MSAKSTQIHYIPYTGHIESGLTEARVKQLEAAETPEVLRCFDTQMQKVIDSGIAFTYNRPAIAGGILIRCANPHKVYDAAFFSAQADNENNNQAKVLPFVKPTKTDEPSDLRERFGYAAAPYHLGVDFVNAAHPPVANNNNGFVPAYNAA